MTGKDLKAFRKSLRITQPELAKLIGRTSARTVQNWENGVSPIPDYLADYLKDLENSDDPEVKEILYKNFADLSVGEQLCKIHSLNLSLRQEIIELKQQNDELRNEVQEGFLLLDVYLSRISKHFKLDVPQAKKSISSKLQQP